MTKTTTRRQRRHGDLPANLSRDGKGWRWNPSASLRKAGWRGCQLKTSDGQPMAEGPAIQWGRTVEDVVKAWRLGTAVPKAFGHIAPLTIEDVAQADTRTTTAFKRENPYSIGALLDAYFASPDFTKLSDNSKGDYRSKLRQFCIVLAEVVAEPGAPKPTAAKIAAVHRLPIEALAPPDRHDPRPFLLVLVHEAFRRRGESMAHGAMAVISAWLTYCVTIHRALPSNPAYVVKRGSPDGRIVTFEHEEFFALVDAADRLGHFSIGDAIVLGIDLSWSQQDLLALKWHQINHEERITHRRMKTKQKTSPKLGALGKDRVAVIRARYGAKGPPHANVIVCETTGRPWKPSHFRSKYDLVRQEAAKTHPAVADKQFRDLRDTAITWFSDAEMTIDQICSRSQHNPTRAQQVIQKHYGAISKANTDAASDKLDAHYAKTGLRPAAPEPTTPPPRLNTPHQPRRTAAPPAGRRQAGRR